jgi:antitoxin component YwqK of YwqJK toxin-antitoxin module
MIGRWSDEEGYMDAKGRFVRQGRRVVWFEKNRHEKYLEDLWLNGKRHGPVIDWWKNGTKAAEFTCVNGEVHGQFRHWYEDGKMSTQEAFLHGKHHGLRSGWYPNGQKRLEVAYVNGQLHGPLRAWYEDGRPKEESLLINGQYEGLARVWGPKSRRADELNYKDGKLHGVVIRHTRDGRVSSRATYKDGALIAPNLDVRKTPVSEFLEMMEAGSILNQKTSDRFRVLWWQDDWFEMFGLPQGGSGSLKWTYVCSDGVLELVNRPVQEGEGRAGQVLISIYKRAY